MQGSGNKAWAEEIIIVLMIHKRYNTLLNGLFMDQLEIIVQQIQCDSVEEWHSTLYRRYNKNNVVINHNPYSNSYTAILSGMGCRTMWIGKWDNNVCKGTVVDRRMEIRDVQK